LSARRSCHLFADADVPVSRVLNMQEHLDDEQVAHNGLYRSVPAVGTKRERRARYPALFDGAPISTDDLPVPGTDA
jgi:crotonobetainyl-CoA:carnitine CoA-transferase CaiB-like acyl-CoA transferase